MGKDQGVGWARDWVGFLWVPASREVGKADHNSGKQITTVESSSVKCDQNRLLDLILQISAKCALLPGWGRHLWVGWGGEDRNFL